ncbi:TetR/AcrR family transcriptional regulator [Pseudonocardia petroleophila]|uniref:TetR/AcrR family transcriptional regulator n=1 Tax=Pseudonocardia petroleophila TaxID=37331 RepID=A0A7G7MPY4_9PSEU|nr:TetR/AcrR family transcriptional regulator [Pseudonocardia petroleophila]QNG54845.1 TetR/AcrR family transcriptional regulator [Pseudonocardia petroleophila]
MTPPVKARPRAAQIAETERRVVGAAARLFVADGYAATTLTAVADAAGVGARTIYVRFGSKAALLKRVVDVAIVGDTEPVDVLGRDWMRAALTAATADERLAAAAAAGRRIMERAGPVFAVAQQAAAVEPLIEAYWDEGRAQTRHTGRVFWSRMAQDGLLDPACDLDRIVDSAAVVCAAETYLLGRRMLGWSPADYEAWLLRTTTSLTRP